MTVSTTKRSFVYASVVAGVAMIAPAIGQSATCPAPNVDGHIIFPDNSILMRTGLQVNPDGAAASYVPGDHGYTYISNGVNLRDNGKKISCSATPENGSRCRKEWARAEAGGFGPGTSEFCVFAMEVEPFSPGTSKSACEGSHYRYIVGNGKGRPKAGQQIPVVGGGAVTSYLSTTTLTHTEQGKVVYVDSGSIPGLVVPRSHVGLVGSLAWVRYGNREVFAIVNDTGPAFGEASVALHQFLRSGQIGPIQAVGPIPLNLRCSATEADLKPPFLSKPDFGENDRCRSGYSAKSPSDIRAYAGIEGDVTSIILADVKPPMSGLTVKEELTPDRIREWILAAGYSPDKLRQMAACISR